MKTKCLHCKGELTKVLEFKKIPIVNNFNQSHKKYKLNLSICNICKLFQNTNFPKKELIFDKNYPYLSSTSNVNKQFFKKLKDRFNLKKNSFIIDIGSNDGAFLNNFKSKKFQHLGIDPSRRACQIAKKRGINCINKFFNYELSKEILKTYGKADVIFSSNTLAHVENLNDIIMGINHLLSDNGKLIIQNIYLYDVIKNLHFDQFYHEHLITYSIVSVKNIYSKFGLYINKIEFNKIQGGSFLIHLSKKKTKISNFKKIALFEKKHCLTKNGNRSRFNTNINKRLIKIKSFINKNKNKKISGYGASAKCVMLLNLLNLDKKTINFVVDNTKFKYNRNIPGTNIPIITPKEFKNKKTDICIIFTWNYVKEIINKEKLKKVKWAVLNNIK